MGRRGKKWRHINVARHHSSASSAAAAAAAWQSRSGVLSIRTSVYIRHRRQHPPLRRACEQSVKAQPPAKNTLADLETRDLSCFDSSSSLFVSLIPRLLCFLLTQPLAHLASRKCTGSGRGAPFCERFNLSCLPETLINRRQFGAEPEKSGRLTFALRF